MTGKKKLVLLNPATRGGLAGLAHSDAQKHPALGLAAVAGLTPDDWEVVIEDELWTPARFHADATLVGATAFTSTAPRAYELLAEYRAAGIPTILGGIHAWARSHEAVQHAGAILVGEAESVWHDVLADAVAFGYLHYIYEGGRAERFARPRYDLIDPRYEFNVAQFSRGCPMCCTFCSVPGFSGQTMRRNSAAAILDDLAQIAQQKVFVGDDNFYGHSAEDHRWAADMLLEIGRANLGKRFVIQASLDVAQDERLLEAARFAGVKLILIGLEAGDVPGLQSIGKRINLAAGGDRLDFSRIHARGMGVLGCYIFGLDTDTRETMLARARWMIENTADCSQMTIATPLPGTPLYRRLERQGRLLHTDFPRDWQRYDLSQAVYVPQAFRSVAEFYDCLMECGEICYCDEALKGMAQRTRAAAGFEAAAWAYTANQKYADSAMSHKAWWLANRGGAEGARGRCGDTETLGHGDAERLPVEVA